MRPTRRTLLGTAATVTTVLAGCIGDGTEADDEAGTPEETTRETTEETADDEPTDDETMEDDEGATVQVRSHPDHGEILVGPEEMTLYMFDQDEEGAGESTCYEGCAESWPPLVAADEPSAGTDVTAELSTFERDDGERQVAAGDWPLYYFAADEEPGDAEGQGVNDVWWVLAPDGTPMRSNEGGGGDGSDEDDDGGDDGDEDDGGSDSGGGGGSYYGY